MAAVRQPPPLIKAPARDLVPDARHWLDGLRLTLLWSWPVCAVMLFLMLAPVVPAMMAWVEDRRRNKGGRKAEKEEGETLSTTPWTGGAVLRFWIAGSYLWLSSLVVETVSLLAWVFTGRARFDNTGAAGRGPGWRVYHANHPLVHLLEVAAGGWFLWQAWALVNPWLAVPGIALATAPLAVRAGWECRAVRCLALLPLIIGLGMFALTIRELLRW